MLSGISKNIFNEKLKICSNDKKSKHSWMKIIIIWWIKNAEIGGEYIMHQQKKENKKLNLTKKKWSNTITK
jgi:hypothetical protein